MSEHMTEDTYDIGLSEEETKAEREATEVDVDTEVNTY